MSTVIRPVSRVISGPEFAALAFAVRNLRHEFDVAAGMADAGIRTAFDRIRQPEASSETKVAYAQGGIYGIQMTVTVTYGSRTWDAIKRTAEQIAPGLTSSVEDQAAMQAEYDKLVPRATLYRLILEAAGK